MKLQPKKLIIAVFLAGILFFGAACQETEPTNPEGQLENCKLLLDKSAWTSAIESCNSVGNDEGWHLASQAYMGRAGLSMFNLLSTLAGADDSTAIIFNFIPDTTSDALDYKSALDNIMGKVETKSQTMYFESLLLSSILILRELKTLLGLSIVDGAFTTCAGDPPDVDNCAFAPTVTFVPISLGPDTVELPDRFVFQGLGTEFYDNLCGHSNDPTRDTYTTIDVSTDKNDPTNDGNLVITATYDVTIDGCNIQNSSILKYNKLANAGYKGFESIGGLDLLNFYPKMDSGVNYSIDIPDVGEIKFCNEGIIAAPEATDDKLNDCEVLGYLLDPGF